MAVSVKFILIALVGMANGQWLMDKLPGQPQNNPAMEGMMKFMKDYFDVFTMKPNADGQWNKKNPSIDNNFSKMFGGNLSNVAKKCHPKGLFASFNPDHRSAVEDLAMMYQGKTDLQSVLEVCEFLKTSPEVHPHVWYASFLRAQVSQIPNDLALDRPSPVHLFPTSFFPEHVHQALNSKGGPRKKRQLPMFPMPMGLPGMGAPGMGGGPFGGGGGPIGGGGGPIGGGGLVGGGGGCLNVDENVGADNGVENALWYFREDVQLNAHHWVWHLLFPTSSQRQIERRGELFYYFHHDMVARYHSERIANGLAPVVSLAIGTNGVIEEGYNAHLSDGVSTQFWAPRRSNVQLNGNALTGNFLERLEGVMRNRQRVQDMLNTGTVNINGQMYPINNVDNINMLGELAEASIYSINPTVYGTAGVHNDDHWIIANILGGYAQGTLGVMAHSATAMRDIAFYRVHAGINQVFRDYKTRYLPPYDLTTGEHPLIFPAVTVSSFKVVSDNRNAPENTLGTFWNRRQFTLEGGLDMNAASSNNAPTISVCAKHLDHEEFIYEIDVENTQRQQIDTMVRIYMAPRYRSVGSQERYTFEEQRHLFFAMDAFVQLLNPGRNVLIRNSTGSTLTAPWPRSIQELRRAVEQGQQANVHCECGFPHHLLLPKGHERGMVFDLFVMLTDAATDLVRNESPNSLRQCIPSHIHCGVSGRPYPDAKPMGYPFDRQAYVLNRDGGRVVPLMIDTYVANVPNMATTQVTINHRDVVMA